MEGLIKKFKKIVHEEKKTQKSQLSETQMKPPSTKEYFESSQISTNSHKRNKTKISKSFSESSLNISTFGRSHSQNKDELLSNDNSNNSKSNLSSSSLTSSSTDSICKIISNTINYIQKNKDNCSLNKIVDNLNLILEEHIRNMSNLRISINKIDQKELLLRTKYETAEKMMKNFELKYLTSEKEKGKLIKQYEDLMENYGKLKERNELHNQEEDKISLLERNNDILIKTNDRLTQEIESMKINEEKIKKSFDKEIGLIQEMLSLYKSNLNKIAQTVYIKIDKS